MLAEMGRALRLVADPLPDPVREQLARLSKRRDQLVAMRTQEKLRRIDANDPAIEQDLDAIWPGSGRPSPKSRRPARR